MPNPVLNCDIFAEASSRGEVMTVGGAIQKTFLLALLCFAAAWFSWGNPSALMLMPVGIFGGLVVALVICFKPAWAPVLSPVYALLEGLFLGAVSSFFEKEMEGILIQTLGLTGGVFFAMLGAYQMNLIQPTRKFAGIVTGATAGIALFYLANMIARAFFGTSFSVIAGNSGIAILFSGFVCVIAALNLIIDFGVIEQGADAGAPKYMEWYSAFGLLVTIVWLYLEILRLLSKLRKR